MILPEAVETKKFTFAPALKPLPLMLNAPPTKTGDDTDAIAGALAYAGMIAKCWIAKLNAHAISAGSRDLKFLVFVMSLFWPGLMPGQPPLPD